jgi:hypothetical protein
MDTVRVVRDNGQETGQEGRDRVRVMYDAAFPPPDPHLDVCAGYIGGDTPHVWTDAEWNSQSARWRLPIFTRSNPTDANQAASDAASAIAWARAHGQPAGTAIALDYETAKDAAYLTAFDADVVAAGWTVLVYGSLSTVFQNPRPSAGYWTASWTGAAHLDVGAAATQWASDTMLGKPYDLSEVTDSLNLWDTQEAMVSLTPQEDNELLQLYNAMFNGGSSMGITPSGATNNSLVSKLDYLITTLGQLATPTVDATALAAALAANPAFVQAVVHGLAVELHNATPSS